MRYMDDPELTWAALGLLAYLDANKITELDSIDTLTLRRADGVWHPSDRGDFKEAWDVLIALGYIDGDDDDGPWRVLGTGGGA